MVKNVRDGVKVLAQGELTKALTIRAHKFSAKAQERITGLGGKAEVIEG
jgi:large subunit ribosomal protein L15